ncbi:MAG: endopeptidase La [Chloroflexi bacterium]|nr:MAG: endopeptidase La [Chloroflexota bacterium]HDN80856.1 endopeptidase La [Chloroflexota bacterium]
MSSEEIREIKEEESFIYPVLPIRDQVIYPNMMTPVYLGRDKSLQAVEAAISADVPVIAVAQKDPDVEDPGPEDLYRVGTESILGRLIRLPDGTASILLQGQRRARILEFVQTKPYLQAKAIPFYEEKHVEDISTEALMRAVLALFEKIVQLDESIPEDAYVAAINIDEPGWFADLIASAVRIDTAKRQEILETLDPIERLQKLSIILARELDVLELENRIQARVQEEMDKAQREYFLREQIRVIQSELGELDAQTKEVAELREKIEQSDMPDQVKEKAFKELERLGSMPPASPEIGIIRTYLDWLLELPWTKATEDNMDIERAARILEERHYGLKKAKERILEYIAVKKLAPDKMRSPILCFVGPPGTGKTSMGRSIAEALGRKFVRMSLGGIRDEAEIRGHRRTYIGAMPGRIIQTMRQAGTINPLFMLDEIDKIGIDFRGDPAAALLEVLDPEQNHSFYDHYLDVPYDLSKVLFITTANILDPIPPALRDRMEVIEFPGYIEEEKVQIAKRFLIPRQLEEHGLGNNKVKFSESALRHIIREYTYEAGVRNLERCIATICRKLARKVAEGRNIPHRITVHSLSRYLGPPQFTYGVAEEKDEVGVATGIAWTEAGGDIMPVEVTLMEGKGNLILTGQLGEVMQESAQAALSYARSHAKELGISRWDFDKLDIHIHVPEGAIPKDGPSAGITIATALISALSHRPVHRDVAMTGEITLRGRILPIGGVREKILAAHRAGLKVIVLPKKNRKDLVEIPPKIRKQLKFIFVERMEEVLPIALVQEPSKPESLPKGKGTKGESKPSR